MKFYLKLTLLFLFPFYAVAQSQNEAKTLKKSLDLAQKKEKLVLLILNPDHLPDFNQKTSKIVMLTDEGVATKAKADFIIFETKRTDTAIRSVISFHKITRFPAYVFMHPSKGVFHIDYGYSTSDQKYVAMFDKAMAMSKEETANELSKQYSEDPTDLALLKKLIETRKRNGVTNNAELIEKYVQGLKISDLNQYETVLFILTSGPYADGNAYKLATTNRKVLDSIYKTESFPTRSAFNNAIISNTMTAAIRTKNRSRALSAASFARNTWNNDYLKANKTYNSQMLYFFNAIKDTASYFRTAIQHMDMFYMNISADSIKKIELKERAAALEAMRPTIAKNTVSKEKLDSIIKANPKAVTRTEFGITSVPASNYANELNNIAYQFYRSGTKNLNHLSKAMLWSKRAIELNPLWGYYDTLAHVYYAMGIHSEAIATQKIAVDLAKNEKNPEYFTRTNQAYEKMKSKVL